MVNQLEILKRALEEDNFAPIQEEIINKRKNVYIDNIPLLYYRIENGKNALQVAASEGKYNFMKGALNSEIEAKCLTGNFAPLSIACDKGNKPLVRLMLKHFKNPEYQEYFDKKYDETQPLGYALKRAFLNKHEEIVKLLLDNYKEYNIEIDTQIYERAFDYLLLTNPDSVSIEIISNSLIFDQVKNSFSDYLKKPATLLGDPLEQLDKYKEHWPNIQKNIDNLIDVLQEIKGSRAANLIEYFEQENLSKEELEKYKMLLKHNIISKEDLAVQDPEEVMKLVKEETQKLVEITKALQEFVDEHCSDANIDPGTLLTGLESLQNSIENLNPDDHQ